MALSYTTARDRDRRRGWRSTGLQRGELLLAATALVSVLALALCNTGRLRAFDSDERARGGGATIDLATVTDPDSLEPVMAAAFDHPADRRLAARELVSALVAERDRASIANVGAITRIAVPAALIDRTPRLSVYADRLRDARRAAADATREAPQAIPLFTSADLAALKPGLIVRGRAAHQRAVLWCAVVLLAAFQAVSLAWRLRGVQGDRLLLAVAHLLTTLGFVVLLSRPDPLRDTLLIVRYTEGVVVALAVFLAASLVNIRTAWFLGLSYLPLAAAIVISVVLIAFGSGPGGSGARINLGPVQPTEAIRLLLALFLAGYFARRWELIRQVRATDIRSRRLPEWLDLPRVEHVLPVFVGVALALVLFFTQRDLGPALLLSLMFLSMFAVARSGVGVVAGGVLLLAAGFYVGHQLGISSTLSVRVAMWQAPWDNAVRGGDQVAQALWALASGGPAGTGLGLGATRFLPAGHTDLALAAIGEELGGLGAIAVAVAFGVMAWRGFRIARAASTDYGLFLAVAMTLTLVVPVLVMAAGLLGLIPLTGVVTPFLSYGGSAMTANFAALGLLVAVAGGAASSPRAAPSPRIAITAAHSPFGAPVRWLGHAALAAGVVLVVLWARVQVVAADDYLVRPQLSRQADGGVRYQYNPRVLDAARQLPRGSIVDRRDVLLATDDPAVVKAAAAEYARMGVSLRDACPDAASRCYPLGPAAFHVLGDAGTRENWAATNTSYVERDEEDRLRGFDDRATAVRTGSDDAPGVTAIRRDYRQLIPLVRHRWEPEHPDVVALRERPRDVRLTIDARLQREAALIVSRAARTAGIEHAAAVVLDTATGEILATVSYPWPTPGSAGGADAKDARLDRARYGLYPPGSTFKLVTAAAALRQDLDLRGLSLACTRLPGRRVGARIPGWSPPIRDDVRDTHPHGTIAMREGLVASCNAYFAQLAVRLGADVMTDTASLAGIALASSRSPGRMRETLPHAGYGQGDVLTTPLRMARVAAAIGSDGMIREAPLVRGAVDPAPTPFLSQDAARLLAGYMRDAVTAGTGRRLRDHPSRIAGKTGTAQIDGAPSHAWFVGVAPRAAGTPGIAFAVILEHAGYGGATAASVAGQLVTAATTLGIAR